MIAPRPHDPQDWAPYLRLEDAVRAYIRDADAALDELAGVIDAADVLSFTCELRPVRPTLGGGAVAGDRGHRRAAVDPVAR